MEDYHDEPYENDLHTAQVKESEQERLNEQAKPTLEDYRKQIKDDKCHFCGFEGLKNLPIEHYDHSDGWPVEGFKELQWLYVICPCGYQWALWKLGVPR